MFLNGWPGGGGMVDATDLKSVGLIAREGSSPSPGTILCKAGTHSFGCFRMGGEGIVQSV